MSRYLRVYAIKDKKANKIAKIFSKIFKEVKPKNIQTDKGSEFHNKTLSALFKKHKVHHYSTKSEAKCAILERAHRTLQNRTYKVFTYRNSYKYLDILQHLVDSYNHSVHRSHGFAPANVTEADEPMIYKSLYNISSPIRFRFSVNDVVRISKARKVFKKGYLPGWTEETFTIYKRYPTNPPTYVLQDLSGKEIKGRFYEEELQKINKTSNDFWAIEKNIRTKGRGSSRQLLVNMKVFPLNTPDHFRTKLARPITLNGEWECYLSEATIPGKYFTVQPGYNDFYSIQQEIDVETETLLPKFDIPLYNDDHADFVAGFNANMKKKFIDPPLIFTLIQNNRQIKIDLKRGWDWIITPAKGNQILNLLRVDPNKDFLITHKQQGFSVIRNYTTPNKEIFKNQETKLIARESILDHTYEIKLEGGDLL
ncbi:putative uncharacterized transposon-derived protein F54H12.3 [Trichonephila clavipes]|nr:putative uncharacterized transposon-derived protein F54H12.3 [Trichonephila clavipes]